MRGNKASKSVDKISGYNAHSKITITSIIFSSNNEGQNLKIFKEL